MTTPSHMLQKLLRKKQTSLAESQLPHPSYSPELAPSNNHLFLSLRNYMRGRYFKGEDDQITFRTFSNKRMKNNIEVAFMICLDFGQKLYQLYIYLVNNILLSSEFFENLQKGSIIFIQPNTNLIGIYEWVLIHATSMS